MLGVIWTLGETCKQPTTGGGHMVKVQAGRDLLVGRDLTIADRGGRNQSDPTPPKKSQSLIGRLIQLIVDIGRALGFRQSEVVDKDGEQK
jgi:hypothetical protein